jgi:uncharacterized protein (DUF488 family)
MNIFTIGFTHKSAETFFECLRENGIQKLVDIRVNPHGQLSGFARQEDLPYFLSLLADGCAYAYMPELAPTKEILKEYRAGGDWPRYVARFEALMDERNIPAALRPEEFASQACCLLCSEATPGQCHRRLVAERLSAHWPDVTIVHL